MRSVPFQFSMEMKRVDTEKRQIEGWASTQDQDRDGDIIPALAFAKSIDTYLKTGTLLYEHGMDSEYQRRTIGKVTEAVVKETGLWIKATVSDDYIWEKIQMGELSSVSWGGRVLDWEEKMVGGKMTFIATDIDLFEVSVVSVPANPQALFNVAKSLSLALNNNENMDELKNMVKSIQERLGDATERDEKIKSLKEDKKTLKSQLDEKDEKIAELEKTVTEQNEAIEELKKSFAELDEVAKSLTKEKKKAVTDEEVEEKDEDKKKSADKFSLESYRAEALFSRLGK